MKFEKEIQMSFEYNKYINEHCEAVNFAYNWISRFVPANEVALIFPDSVAIAMSLQLRLHDESKWKKEEYNAYDNYFYGDKNDPKIAKEFDYAWLHHIHINPHHWQHWVLLEDDPSTGDRFKALDIPDMYIIEMICDWWSFSWREYNKTDNPEDLNSIFKWYDEHKKTIIFSKNTREKVEKFLELLKNCIKSWST